MTTTTTYRWSAAASPHRRESSPLALPCTSSAATSSGHYNFAFVRLDKVLGLQEQITDQIWPRKQDMAELLQNPPNGAWVIQKFGGTSVGKSAERIAGEIVP